MALEFNTCNSPLKDFYLREAAKRAEQARASGTERVRPLRIVLISSFYYAALAAGIIDKKEDYRYQSALDVRQKCRALAEVDPAKKFASLTEAELKELIKSVDEGDCDGQIQCAPLRRWRARLAVAPLPPSLVPPVAAAAGCASS